MSSSSTRSESIPVFSHKTVVENYLLILFHVSLEVVGIEILGLHFGLKQLEIGEQVVTLFYIPFDDAYQIMNTSGGVIQGSKGMNEIGPHKAWAQRIMMRSEAYGVIEHDGSYLELFGAW